MSDDIDIGEISEALSNKMDRDAGNSADLGKERIVGWNIPDYANGITVSSSPYEAPSAGRFIMLCEGSPTGGASIYVNSIKICAFGAGSAALDRTLFADVSAGDVITYTAQGSSQTIKFYPFKGI